MKPKLLNAFAEWLDDALAQVPPEASAFNFNLAQSLATWDIEFTGAESYDPADPDWAVDPIYSYPPMFSLSKDDVGLEWEGALAAAIELVTTYIRSGAERDVLRASIAVGVGFVDGYISIVWPENAA